MSGEQVHSESSERERESTRCGKDVALYHIATNRVTEAEPWGGAEDVGSEEFHDPNRLQFQLRRKAQ